MVPSVNPAFLDVTDGTVLGEARPATPEDGLRIRPNPVRKPKVLTPPPLVIEVVGEPRGKKQQRRAQRQEQRGASTSDPAEQE